MEEPVLSNSRELARVDRDPVASRTYEVLIQYAAVLTVEATDHADAHDKARGSTVLAAFDHGISVLDETILGVRPAVD